ncbi:hypothetical protein B0H10DRAFT_1961868 [Mycena sp. CBHHK59/15]|nr:hypothetical protein B0H10DRAFT_1961868 [Mycena sp. CBHHK59/15]
MYYVLDIVLGAIPDASKAAAGKRRGGKIISTHFGQANQEANKGTRPPKSSDAGSSKKEKGKSKAEAQDNNTFKALGSSFQMESFWLQLVSYSAFHSQNVNKGEKADRVYVGNQKGACLKPHPRKLQDGTKTKTHPDTVWKSPRSAGSGTWTQIVPKNLLLTTRSSATSIQRDGEGKGMDGIALNDVLVTEV